ncbi:MAG: DUF2252 domain-containing protein [Paludisphaera borealis]|uniref:DUF2252 domain-containing protein n=1 Tax=Paludisphaera borealis TaxID=1387353 RepID=UPI00284DE544|nr:DUF2252 domain-containing protein [Paludisphaera borealis]MDR3623233.1 DUF2252 domain-containing protein [Paludisphaera borealis]
MNDINEAGSERYQQGRRLRDACPRKSHAEWRPAADRPDPIALLEASSRGRIPELIPVRYGRMLQSPFAFYRGAAFNMAADLATTPASGPRPQICGDCHLLNFGAFATPERRVVFDINDFDETFPAPWEWDVKRLAASFVLACRFNGFSEVVAGDVALACVRSYRERLAEFSRMRVLESWYAKIELDDLIPLIKDEATRKQTQKRLAKARERSVREHDDPKLEAVVDGEATIKDNPPLIYHLPELGRDAFAARVLSALAGYRESLAPERRALLDRFELKDVAIKVVGVGSVGTWCSVALLLAGEHDPLFLQIKEARASVLEPYAGGAPAANHGERIVLGCRLMQSASDLFLGWTQIEGGVHFYVRQLKDMKIKPLVELFNASVMLQYAQLCGWSLARAHARSGGAAEISGYLGRGDVFDKAVAAFSFAYADQTERDHEVLVKAVHDGRLQAESSAAVAG